MTAVIACASPRLHRVRYHVAGQPDATDCIRAQGRSPMPFRLPPNRDDGTRVRWLARYFPLTRHDVHMVEFARELYATTVYFDVDADTEAEALEIARSCFHGDAGVSVRLTVSMTWAARADMLVPGHQQLAYDRLTSLFLGVPRGDGAPAASHPTLTE